MEPDAVQSNFGVAGWGALAADDYLSNAVDDGGGALKLRILGHPITVTRVKPSLKGMDNMGECESFKGTISIRSDLEESVYTATLLHEVLHMLDHYLELKLSEEQVTGLGEGLFSALRDNPELGKQLCGK